MYGTWGRETGGEGFTGSRSCTAPGEGRRAGRVSPVVVLVRHLGKGDGQGGARCPGCAWWVGAGQWSGIHVEKEIEMECK